MKQKKERIELMDAARGLSLILMVVHHFFYDLVVFAGAPRWLFWNPAFTVGHYIFAGLFILLAGASSNFSHSNTVRGFKTLGIALVITLVTTIMNVTIVFGVLHLLGTCMLLYGLTRRFWEGVDEKCPWLVPALSAAGVLATTRLTNGYPTSTPHLWMFGLVTENFRSADYFPLLPWVFVFLLGTWVGKYIRAGRMPRRFYEAKAPRLAAVGRQSLLIYVVHQPVLYALTMLGLQIFKR